VQDRDGRFSLRLSTAETRWVGVAAEGFAAWEGWVDAKRSGGPLEIRLSSGVVVSGSVVLPAAIAKGVRARLLPRRDKSDMEGSSVDTPAEKLPTRPATVTADGMVRFEHVRPDRYWLFVEGEGILKTAFAVDVPGSGLDMGAVKIAGPTATGRIEGRIWRGKSRDNGGWALASGEVRPSDFAGMDGDRGRIEFRADESGRFHVDGVPIGLSTVGFTHHVGADVFDEYTWSALVVEGRRLWSMRSNPRDAESSRWRSRSEMDRRRSTNQDPDWARRGKSTTLLSAHG